MITLTRSFTLEELTKTDQPFKNVPDTQSIVNLTTLCIKILQPLRDAWMMPIYINSGYRSSAVNKAVGGSVTSQHLTGCAADITTRSKSGNSRLVDLITLLGLPFDQCIIYGDYRFIHISYGPMHRRSVIYT